MNWSQMQSLFDGQGLVFWAAITAVTLGLTLLSVSIVFQVRRLLRGRRLRWRAPRLRRRSQAIARPHTPRITVTDAGYQADGFRPDAAPPAAARAPDVAGLRDLLQRLRAAGDRLAQIQTALGPERGPGAAVPDSPLKSPVEDVDYIYKTGNA